MDKITVTVDATEENLAKIASLLFNKNVVTTQTTSPATDSKKKETESVKKDAVEESEHSLADLKEATKLAKKEHGEDFCNSVFEQFGELKSTLGRTVSAVDTSNYSKIIELLVAGPSAGSSDDLDDDLDDDLGEEDSDVEIDAETVKMALKAYSKEKGRDEARKIMQDIGKAKTLSKVDECSKEQLAKMMNAMA